MVELNTDPTNLTKAGDGITGVIDALAQTGVGSAYTAGAGRGFGDLDMDAKAIGHADPQTGLTTFCNRWEWGVRALVQGARNISTALKLGASVYEREDRYQANNLKAWGNDLLGDPNLQRSSYVDPTTGEVVEGTDDMSAGEVLEHNKNALTQRDWEIDAADRKAIAETYRESWESIKADGHQFGETMADPMGSGLAVGKDLLDHGITPTEVEAPPTGAADAG